MTLLTMYGHGQSTKKHEVLPMRREMEKGYVFLSSGLASSFLCWAKDKPTISHIPEDRIILLRWVLYKSPKDVSEAYICKKCQIITFEYPLVEDGKTEK